MNTTLSPSPPLVNLNSNYIQCQLPLLSCKIYSFSFQLPVHYNSILSNCFSLNSCFSLLNRIINLTSGKISPVPAVSHVITFLDTSYNSPCLFTASPYINNPIPPPEEFLSYEPRTCSRNSYLFQST